MQELGHMAVDFETDAKVVVDGLNQSEDDETEFGDIIALCRSIMDANPGFEVRFERRNRNMVAHTLARRACALQSPMCGVTPPVWLQVF
ncbi:hypothetical protein LINPERPRIM_LOCUS41604 [Linum perenne]